MQLWTDAYSWANTVFQNQLQTNTLYMAECGSTTIDKIKTYEQA